MYQSFDKGFFNVAFMRSVRNALPALTAVTLACSPYVVHASSQQQINNISTKVVSPSKTELTLSFSGKPVMPKAYQIENPSRLILDFKGVKNGLSERYKATHTGQVTSITSIDNQELTRLVIALSKKSDFATRVVGNTLVLKVSDKDVASKPAVSQSVTKPYISKPATSTNNSGITTTASLPATTVQPKINPLLNPRTAKINQNKYQFFGLKRVNFSRVDGDAGKVALSLANSNVPVDVQRKGNKLVIRMLGAKVPKNLRRRMNVKNYGTPVSNIDAFNDGNNGTVVVYPKGEFDYQVYQADSRLTVEVRPIIRVRDPRPKQKTYTGKPLSMDFQDVEIRAVLQLIADFTDINLVASDSVNGRMTLRLQNVPWDQALDIILKSRGLDKRRNGNVIMVAPASELVAQEKKEIESKIQFKELAPIRTEYVQLNYAKVNKIQALIGTNRGSENNNSLLSDRGTVTVDERTNTLIIQDTSDKIDEIRALVSKLDVPVKQVMIEARIVRATDSFSKELGVKWGILSDGAANNRNLLVGGSEQTLWDLREFDVETQQVGNTSISYPSYTIERPSNLNVDLGVTSTGASRIAFGLLRMSDFMLDLELSALQADGNGEVVSTPKVLTMDKQTASVASGTQIPYQKATSSGATAVEFKNVELSLEVTPSITPEGRVAMELKVNSDSPGSTLANGEVTVNTNRIDTNVLVDDGQTVVLGGIFQNQTSSSVTKAPFLGDLPYVGRLFRKTVNNNNKQELLIFVTPRLVNESVTNAGR